MQPTKCKIFLKGFCPRKELCQNSHDIKNCMSGPNCTIKNQCPDRHPPLCKNFVKNTCGFFVGNKFIVFSNCAFFHPPGVNQVPPSTSSVMLTTTAPNTITAPATGQNTPPENITEDTQVIPKQNNKLGLSWWPFLPQNKNQVSNAKSEIEVNSGISPANQVTKQLSDLNSKIVKIEQNLSLLADKMANMDAKINQVEEAIKQSDSMQTNLDQLANDFNHQSGNIKDLQEKVSSNTREISKFMGLQETVSSNMAEVSRLFGTIFQKIRELETALQKHKESLQK